jgi:hypothetical protein
MEQNTYYLERYFFPESFFSEKFEQLLSSITTEKGEFCVGILKWINREIHGYNCPYSADQFKPHVYKVKTGIDTVPYFYMLQLSIRSLMYLLYARESIFAMMRLTATATISLSKKVSSTVGFLVNGRTVEFMSIMVNAQRILKANCRESKICILIIAKMGAWTLSQCSERAETNPLRRSR